MAPAGTDTREVTFSYSLDLSGFEEGSLYIKFEAYDSAGNKNAPGADGKEIICVYRIDRTAPEKLQGVKAVSGGGYIEITWDASPQEDVKYYKICRADEKDGVYREIEPECRTKNYYDTSAGYGETYLYKVAAVDMAGNTGELSDAAVAAAVEDTQAPVIRSMSPYDGSLTGTSATVKVLAVDNAMVSTVTIEYAKADSEEIFTTLVEEELNAKDGLVQAEWNTDGLEDGEYIFRVYAKDASGNESAPYEVKYTLDTKAPAAPYLKSETGNFCIRLTMSGAGQESDFAYYEIRRREAGTGKEESEGGYRTIARLSGSEMTQSAGYTDTDVEVNVMYDYVVRAYDFAGNHSESFKTTCYADDNDTEAPVAVLPENLIGMEGMEIAFDGTASTDNVRIKDYTWYMGDGTVMSGAQPVHAYDRAGTYVVVLEVADRAGNTKRTTSNVRIVENTGKGTACINVTGDDGIPIPFADIYVRLDDDSNITLKTDSQGRATIADNAGTYKVAAYKKGYLPSDTDIDISSYETKEYHLVLKKSEIVTGEMKVRKLTYEEMIKEGVNLSDPSNYNTFEFTITLELQQTPLPVEHVHMTKLGGTKLQINPSQSDGAYAYGGSTGTESGQENSGISIEIKEAQVQDNEDVPILAYVSTTQSVSWLKEMFCVELGILNAADSSYSITESQAVIHLPKGISLASASGNTAMQKMGTINGQEKKNVSWIIRGDESGSYQVCADFSGKLMPFGSTVSAHFETEKEIEVSTGEGLHIYILPEKSAYIGEKYYIQFIIANESDRDMYKVSTTIGEYEAPKTKAQMLVKYSDKYAMSAVDRKQYANVSTKEDKAAGLERWEYKDSVEYDIAGEDASGIPAVLNSGDRVCIDRLKAGQRLYGTYSTDFEAKGNPQKVYYELVDYALKVWKGANLGVKVSVIPIESHMSMWILKSRTTIDVLFGDPVDLSTGSFSEEMTLLSVNGAGQLDFDISYDSKYSDRKSETGCGWTNSHEMRLEDYGGYIRTYIFEDVYMDFILKDSADGIVNGDVVSADDDGLKILLNTGKDMTCGSYICITENMDGYSLEKKKDGTYLLFTPEQESYVFDADGRIMQAGGRDGKTLIYTYGDKEKTVTDRTTGVYLKLHYNDEGLITAVTDNSGREAQISYEEGHISSVTDAEGHIITFGYEPGTHRLVTEAGNDGKEYLLNRYDEDGRVVAQRNGTDGAEWTYIRYAKTSEGTKITAEDETGSPSYVCTDSDGRVTKVTDARGKTTVYEYDENGNVTKTINPNGAVINMEYDGNGNIISVTDPLGNTIKLGYDKNNNITSVTDAYGNSNIFIYDESNHIIYRKFPSGEERAYTYNADGLMETETIEGLGTSRTEYTDGRMTGYTDRNGNHTAFEYDSVGNLIKAVYASGNTLEYEYDRLGRIILETDSDGRETAYTYDQYGNRTDVTDDDGNTAEYVYDPQGRLIRETDADGAVTEYFHDEKGNNTQTVYSGSSHDGKVYRKYDENGNVTEVTYQNGSVIRYEYDDAGNLIRETDPAGNSIDYEYCLNGKLSKKIYPDGESVSYEYNANGKLTKKSDASGNTTLYEYNSMGLKTKETDPLGSTKLYEYDIYGRLKKETDANGNETCYGYDANGNLIKKINAEGTEICTDYNELNLPVCSYVVTKDGTRYEIKYGYDPAGNLTSITDEEGNTTYVNASEDSSTSSAGTGYTGSTESADNSNGSLDIYSTDDLSILSDTENLNGTETEESEDMSGGNPAADSMRRVYDRLGRLEGVYDAGGSYSSVSYDIVGNISGLTDANGNTTLYEYNCMGQLTKETTAARSIYEYTYNAQGLLERIKNAGGRETEYRYDASGRITGMTDELGTVSYTYDNNGNVLKVTDENGTIERTYDKLNRVKSYTDYKGNTIKYGYDELGNLITLTYPGGEIIRYAYYKNGLLKSVTDFNGNVTLYDYNSSGQPVTTERPDGTTEECIYDENGRLAEKEDYKENADGSVTIISHYEYEYDENGNIIRITESDAAGETESSEADDETEFSSEPAITAGEKTEEPDTGGDSSDIAEDETCNDKISIISMEYDAANRLISYNGEEVKYDADGNMVYGPLNGEMAEYRYDCRNRLVSCGETVYTYNAENVRMSASTDTYMEEYVTDAVSSEYSRLLETRRYEKDSRGKTGSEAQTTYYVYGNGLASQISKRADDESVGAGKTDSDEMDAGSSKDTSGIRYIYRYYHYNHLGNTIKLTDETGSITDSYVYGTYGELLSGDNSTTKFLYNGSYGVMTEDNGLYYMRARYYNPDIKRFINQDVIKGTIADSQSLNRYSYVQGNPVSYIDPFGLSPISASIGHGILMAGIIITSIAAPEVAVPLMLIDSAWYFMDGDVYSGIANLVMMGAGGVARFAGNSIAARLFRFGFYGYVFGSSGVEFVKNEQRIYKKYHDYGKKPKLDEDTLGDFLDLTLPAAGMYIGAKGLKETVSTPKTNTSAAKEGAGEKAEEKLIGNENIKPEESAGEKTQSEQVTDPHRTSNRTNTKSLTKENEEMPGNSNVITAKENGSEKGNDVLRDEAVRNESIKVKNKIKYVIRKIDEIKDKSILEKVRQRKSVLNSYLRGKNSGYAEVNVEGLEQTDYFANSSVEDFDSALSDECKKRYAEQFPNLTKDEFICPQLDKQEFTTLFVDRENNISGDGWDRCVDVESKILEYINLKLKGIKNPTGTIKLFTDYPPCPSCKGVIEQFINKYPNIKIEVIYERKVR